MAVTLDSQLEWRGVQLGNGTALRTVSLAGWWDLPAQRGSNTARPGAHGSFPGQKVSGDRLITWEFNCGKTVPLDQFKVMAALLRRITAPTENPVEEMLQLQLDGIPLQVQARCIRRMIPTDQRYALGYTAGAVQWEATDPRLYSVTEMVVPISLPVSASGGLDFGGGGLDFGGGGLDFGSGTSGGTGLCTNDGDVPTWPVIEIDGPVTGPLITFPSGRRLLFDPTWSVQTGQTLLIDTRPGVRSVEIAGVSVSQRLWVREWEPLFKGSNVIRFGAAAYSAGQARVRFRHAYH